MIFQYTHEQVLSGEKTQTRREAKKGDRAITDAHGKVIAVENRSSAGRTFTRYRVGAEYAVQPGRGKKALGRIELIAIKRAEHARQISTKDAHAEGFNTAAEFRETYGEINGEDSLGEPCWVLTFRLV